MSWSQHIIPPSGFYNSFLPHDKNKIVTCSLAGFKFWVWSAVLKHLKHKRDVTLPWSPTGDTGHLNLGGGRWERPRNAPSRRPALNKLRGPQHRHATSSQRRCQKFDVYFPPNHACIPAASQYPNRHTHVRIKTFIPSHPIPICVIS